VSAPARLALFAGLLAVVFSAAAVAGGAIDPSGADRDAEPAHGGEAEHGGGGALPGLQVADAGHRRVVSRSTGERGTQQFSFRIVDEHGEPVRDFELEHEKRMHMIVVRRDTARFQHLHPALGADGTWTARADFSAGGTYRVYADFTRGGEQRTLGADVQVAGAYRPRSLPAPAPTARSDGGLDVTLKADRSRLAFSVRDGGRVVDGELEPYLGAKGHLVALRGGDLAYLHTHPDGDELAFETSFPSAGTYRMFVQFRHGGRVHTASFTHEVAR
jgi:hypothetical protein